MIPFYGYCFRSTTTLFINLASTFLALAAAFHFLELGAFRHHAVFYVAPQGNRQSSRHRNDRHTSTAFVGGLAMGLLREPDGELTVRLIAQPHPRHFYEQRSDSSVTLLADALVDSRRTTVIRLRYESNTRSNLFLIIKLSPQ